MNYNYTFIIAIVCLFFYSEASFSQSNINILNTPANEHTIIISPKGDYAYFVRENSNENIGGAIDKGDIWKSKILSNGMFGPAANAGSLVNNENETKLIGFDPTGDIMYLIFKPKLQSNPTLGFSRLQNGRWSQPKIINIKFLSNTAKINSGCISSNGNKIVLSIRNQGYEDLYLISKISQTEWSYPMHLGETINTSSQEISPFLAENDTKLFFISNGLKGEGSKDVFYSKRLNDNWKEWSKPKNAGTQINSPGMEISYSQNLANDIAYTSTIMNSKTYGEFKATSITPPVLAKKEPVKEESNQILASLEESPTKEPAPKKLNTEKFTVEIVDEQTQKKVKPKFEIIDKDGNVHSFVMDPDKDFVEIERDLDISKILVKGDGYKAKEISYDDLRKGLKLTLEPFKVGETFTLTNVFFQQGTASFLGNSSTVELDKLVNILNDNDDMVIEISGHTDNRGSLKAKMRLSQERADKVKEYLLSNGIDKDRVTAKGYGSMKPVTGNGTEEQRKQNRRVEFKILKH
ncbi:OmpA family protein [Aureibacter tunicatorum]|uniref:Outer membrane protein OmpA-like peptidoglycan-associated protein n=1 Tax=Aureibacter tunicatorum TaxID=866807 RepID=A0AAE3XNN4_9BACT|nr:OmpA family protein [Aureibacter tunicatorum]MDR6239086.1 outer membrane protein OmpA-like peptidoglycan-associated protein [Aureibacter tunicatorum]BDD04988.1 hypothetical protein AUTU_24710 [Aureibacter tunicatorum]